MNVSINILYLLVLLQLKLSAAYFILFGSAEVNYNVNQTAIRYPCCMLFAGHFWVLATDLSYEKTSKIYCNKTVYIFAYFVILIPYIMIAIVIVFFCCCCWCWTPCFAAIFTTDKSASVGTTINTKQEKVMVEPQKTNLGGEKRQSMPVDATIPKTESPGLNSKSSNIEVKSSKSGHTSEKTTQSVSTPKIVKST